MQVLPWLALVHGFFAPGLSAQKRVSKELLDPVVESIVVEGEQCYRILLETADTREVHIAAEMEGEYQEALLIQSEVLGNTLRISTGFAPDFELPNDKLGAHKVFSVDLRIVLPRYQRVTLFAGNGQVAVRGRYRTFKARMDGGNIRLEHLAERTDIRTRTAGIDAQISHGTITADSRYGRVEIGDVPAGGPSYQLQSNQGNIRVHTRP